MVYEYFIGIKRKLQCALNKIFTSSVLGTKLILLLCILFYYYMQDDYRTLVLQTVIEISSVDLHINYVHLFGLKFQGLDTHLDKL